MTLEMSLLNRSRSPDAFELAAIHIEQRHPANSCAIPRPGRQHVGERLPAASLFQGGKQTIKTVAESAASSCSALARSAICSRSLLAWAIILGLQAGLSADRSAWTCSRKAASAWRSSRSTASDWQLRRPDLKLDTHARILFGVVRSNDRIGDALRQLLVELLRSAFG